MTSKWKLIVIHALLLLGLTATGWITTPLFGAKGQEILCYTERITNAPSFNIYTGRNDPNNPIVWTHTVPAGILDSVVRVGLYIEAWDVDDPPQGDEYDHVYFNGYDLGYLDGDNNTWRTVEKTVPVAALREGINNLQVYVDELGKDWKVTIRASELRFYCSTPDPDFSIGTTPATREITAGESTSYNVNLTALNGFNAAVNLSVSGLPTGVSGVFLVNPLTPSPTAETTLNITSTTTAPAGTYTLTVRGASGQLQHETTVALTIKEVPLPADFTIQATPTLRTLHPGEATQYQIDLTAINGFNETTQLGITGLPTEASAAFNPESVRPTGQSLLNITTTTNTPIGEYTLTVTATGGSKSHAVTITLKIEALPPQPDFSITATPATQEITVGESTQFTVNLSGLNGFRAPVNLTVTGLPTEATGLFAVNPLTPTPTAETSLTITTTSTVVAGTYTLTISGENGGKSHSTQVTLTLKSIPPPPVDFSIKAEPYTRTVYPGNTTDYQLVFKAINGFKERTRLSITGLPADTHATFAPAALIPSALSVLTITTTEKTPLGEYTLDISATGGEITHVVKVTLKVEAQPLEPEFTITVTPPSRSIYPGETSGYTVTLTPLNGFDKPLALTVAGVPTDCTAQFSESTVTPPGTSVLRLTPTETTRVGEYSLVVTAKGGGLEHTATVTMTVACRDFSLVLTASHTSGPAPLTVAFTAAVQRDGTLLPADYRYAWNFGDGSTSNDQNPEHIFQTPGLYTVTATATDACGITRSASTQISIDSFEGSIKKEFSVVEAQPGQELDILLYVTNQTRQDFRDVIISDELSPSFLYIRDNAPVTPKRSASLLTWSIPLLKQGETIAFNVHVKLSATAPQGTITNIAYLTHQSLGAGKNIPSNTAILTVFLLQVSLQKQVEQTTVLPGGVVKYILTVQNNSAIPLTQIQLADVLSGNLEFVSQSQNSGLIFSRQGNSLLWSGLLEAQQQALIHIEARVPHNVFAGTRIENSATLKAEKLKEPISSNTVLTTVIAQPVPSTKVRFNKRCEVPQSEVGRIIRFNVTTTNLSESTLIAPLLEDYMPQGFSYVAGSTLLNGQFFVDPQGNRHMVWQLPDINPGQTLTMRYQVVIGADVSRGRNENRATLRTRDNSGQDLFFEDAAFVNVSIAGFVFYSGVEGTVYLDRDDDNFYSGEDTPLENIEMRLSGGQKALTDRMGRYTFENLFPGEYALSVNRATIPEKYKVADPFPVVVTLADGLTDTKDFAIKFQGVDEVKSARLTGRVFYDKNKNLRYDSDDALAVKFEARLDGKLLTMGSNGIFIFTHLELGLHSIEILYDRRVVKKEITLIKGNNTIDIPLLFTGIKIIVTGEEQ